MGDGGAIELREVEAARDRIAGAAIRTPIVRLGVDESPAQIYLKLENLQPIGSFKLRGATNAIAVADPSRVAEGVWTASAGNMAQGVAWCARRLGVPCTVIIPDTAPEAKRTAIERLGGRLVPVPFDVWFDTFRTREYEGMKGVFVHAFSDLAVMAGNGTIGLEIMDDLPDVDAVVVPYGGGGLSCGIASAVKAVAPHVRVYAAEVETAAPLAASLEAGHPVEVPFTPSFVDGIGAPRVFPEMFELAQRVLDGSLVVSVEQAADAVRLMAERNHFIAEGAGGVPVAAALAGLAGGGTVACVVSGGNIDGSELANILAGDVPG
jgi:threonine dehydratase